MEAQLDQTLLHICKKGGGGNRREKNTLHKLEAGFDLFKCKINKFKVDRLE